MQACARLLNPARPAQSYSGSALISARAAAAGRAGRWHLPILQRSGQLSSSNWILTWLTRPYDDALMPVRRRLRFLSAYEYQLHGSPKNSIRRHHHGDYLRGRLLRRFTRRRRPARDGRVPLAQHQQAPAPRAPAQRRPGHLGVADARRHRAPGGQVHPDQRPRGAHLQEHARLGALRQRRNPGVGRREGRPLRRQVVRALRHRIRKRLRARAEHPGDAQEMGSRRPRDPRPLEEDEPVGL